MPFGYFVSLLSQSSNTKGEVNNYNRIFIFGSTIPICFVQSYFSFVLILPKLLHQVSQRQLWIWGLQWVD